MAKPKKKAGTKRAAKPKKEHKVGDTKCTTIKAHSRSQRSGVCKRMNKEGKWVFASKKKTPACKC